MSRDELPKLMRIRPATARPHAWRLILALVITGLLTGCGQKGPLVLPDPQAEPVTQEPAPTDESDDQEGETSDD